MELHNWNDRHTDDRSFGQRMADKVAAVGGSWGFIGCFMLFLVGWASLNTFILLRHPFDPYPFIFLNLLLSMLAAIQAPVIMMSQNRAADRDRRHAEHDYMVGEHTFALLRRLCDAADVPMEDLAEDVERIDDIIEDLN